MYDVIVVGGGHNGLTCAAYLARSGRRVLVLEGREIIGGYCTTEETVAAAPGFKMSPCAVDTTVTNVPASVVEELNLAQYGLRFVAPDPWASHIRTDGASIAFWKQWQKTRDEIGRFSKRDAAAFEDFNRTMIDALWMASAYLQDHPTRPRPKTIGQLLWRAVKASPRLRGALRIFLGSPQQFIEERFEREEVKAAFANLASWSMVPLEEPGSAGCLGIMCMNFKWGVTRPVGGVGAFAEALAACVRAHGGEVRAAAKVARIDVRGDGATGVTLDSGERIAAREVVGALDPWTLMEDLVERQHVPDKVLDELRGTGNLRWNITCLKVDVAIDHRPKLACGREELWQGYMLLNPDMEYVRRSQRAAMYGILPEEIVMGPIMPSRIDRTLVPSGSEGESIYLYCPCVPEELRDGSRWADIEGGFFDSMMKIYDEYAPGISDAVIGHWSKTPDEFAKTTRRGHILHVDMSMNYMGPWRPTPTLSGYQTPIPGLWHTGAGAHPFGTLNGWSGRTTARWVEKVLRGAPRPPSAADDLDREPVSASSAPPSIVDRVPAAAGDGVDARG